MKQLKRTWSKTPRLIRQLFVLIVGVAVIIAGIIMLAIPGPGWLTIFLGLAILSTEFFWARRTHDWVVSRFKSAYQAVKASNRKKK